MKALWIVTLLLVLPTVSAAQEVPLDPMDALLAEARGESATGAPAEHPNPSSAFGWLFFGAGFVALSGYALVQYRRKDLALKPDKIDLVSTLSLGPKHRISVVEIDGTRLLIGLADGSITTLHDFQSSPDRSASPRPAQASATEPMNPGNNKGLFDNFEGALARASSKTLTNRESDSVLIGLQALEARNRGIA